MEMRADDCAREHPPQPGSIVRRDCIDIESHWPERYEAAKALGVTRQALNHLVNEKPASRRRLPFGFRSVWQQPRGWLRLAASYDLGHIDADRVRKVRKERRECSRHRAV